MKLRVFLPASDTFDPARPCAWTLFDARGAVLRAGTTPLPEAPRAALVEAALPASRVLFARLRLPRVNAATIRELLPFAVEDRLLADPANIHAVAGPKNAAGETLVAVVDRLWLERALQAMRAAGFEPRSACCESALLAGGRGDWHVVLGPDHGFLVDDDGVAVAFDRTPSSELPLAIRVALEEAAGRASRPETVRAHASAGAPLPDLARWTSQSGVRFEAAPSWEEVSATPFPRNAIDLLGSASMRRLGAGAALPRAALILGVAIAVLQLAFTGIDAWRLSVRHAGLVARQEAIFRAAFPEAKALVDPALQMERNLGELQRSRGLAAADDFLAQATRAARELPEGTASLLVFSNGRLDVRRGERVAKAAP